MTACHVLCVSRTLLSLCVVYYWFNWFVLFCVFMYILSFGAVGFMFTGYLRASLSTNILHFLIVFWICFWYASVGSLFSCVM